MLYFRIFSFYTGRCLGADAALAQRPLVTAPHNLYLFHLKALPSYNFILNFNIRAYFSILCVVFYIFIFM